MSKRTVAVLLDEGATIIDFAGPWDAFKAATDENMKFRVFAVAPTKQPIQTMGSLTLVPDYTFADSPQANIIVIPTQGGGKDPAKLEWIRSLSRTADYVMSVCTGSFILARTGLLDDQMATTHHEAYDLFEKTFPKVQPQREVPFVVSGKLSPASAVLAGVDLALQIVTRYPGITATEEVAKFLGHHDSSCKDQ
jgi:transcriptional regulator GlxA family with amidase domain